ncbi:MAG TPA: hypothetical protein VGP43_06055 [Chitinophagaceae bacterium]|nr:hypothetical protein [Chitinophagaceae bacterium]
MVDPTKKFNKKQVDIINTVLEECILAYPVSSFVISIYKQYMQRGSLSKKQLQGVYSKASQIQNIQQSKLATLEAIIKKMPTKNKSELPENKPMFERDESVGKIITTILTKYPQHKRVLFLKAKYENNDLLSIIEIDELRKFEKVIKR